MPLLLQDRRKEFDSHLWNHSEDIFQTGFDEQVKFEESQLQKLRALLEIIHSHNDSDVTQSKLTELVTADPSFILTVMQSVGLTRNKILTDLKGAGFKVPSKPQVLISRPDIWPKASAYLAHRVHKVLGPLSGVTPAAWNASLESLNQATWPGWIRQERAKRQGHEAEGRIANLLKALNLQFAPEEKADNPLCPDVRINGVSFDIVAPSAENFRVGFKSTVQTSNIGQFGESKGGLEVREAAEMVAKEFQKPVPLVIAMVDGVGFHSNTAGLSEILQTSDEFCQFATLWKAAVIVASSQNVKLEIVLPDSNTHTEFLSRYSDTVQVTEIDPHSGFIEAGEGWLRRHSNEI